MNHSGNSGETLLEAFEARNAEYAVFGHDRFAAARFVVDEASPMVGPALDVGTGKGVLAVELARRGMEVITIDTDVKERPIAQALARREGVLHRIAMLQGDASHLSYEDGHFQTVAMMDVLHHLEDATPILQEMARVVADSGTLLIADFNEEGFSVIDRMHRQEGGEHPQSDSTVAGAISFLQGLGFSLIKEKEGALHHVAVLTRPGAQPEISSVTTNPGPMLFYNDVVIDHFMHPRNVGELPKEEISGFGLVGDPTCGDQMILAISVVDDKIARIAFKSFGCPGAIATSSMLTVLAEGKTLEEAAAITDDDVVSSLGGIPEKKRHCSLMGVRALRAALDDYGKQQEIK